MEAAAALLAGSARGSRVSMSVNARGEKAAHRYTERDNEQVIERYSCTLSRVVSMQLRASVRVCERA